MSATSCRSGWCAPTRSGGGSGTIRAAGECTLASVTSFTYRGDEIVSVGYSEPAIDLVPAHLRGGGVKPPKGTKAFGA